MKLLQVKEVNSMCDKNTDEVEKKEAKIRNRRLKKVLKHQRKMEKVEIRNKRLPIVIFGTVFLSIIVIVLTTMITIIGLCDNLTSSSKEMVMNGSTDHKGSSSDDNVLYISVNDFEIKAEATLLASGLSIIGIAISVWAGLNIVNALERKDLEEVQNLFKDTVENISKEAERLGKQIFEEKNKIALIKEERQNIYRGLFLQELMNTNHDAMSRYFYKCFAEYEILETADYTKLILIEQYFSQVYTQYSEKTSVKSLLLSRIEDGVKQIDAILNLNNENVNLLLEKYLCFRKHEFSFLKGYILGGVQKYETFRSSARGFEEISYKFDLVLPCMNEDIEDAEYRGKEEKLQVAVYFLNTIGEAYSKIIEDISLVNQYNDSKVKITKDEMIGYAKKAIAYLKLAVKWNQRLEEREVYYRNLGCAYERMDKLMDQFGQHSKQIINNYKKAFQVAILNGESNLNRIQKIYHTLLSYYERHIKFSFGYEEGKHAFEKVSELSELLKIIKKQRGRNVQKYLIDYRRVVELGVTDTVRGVFTHNMNGLSWTWIVVFLLSGDEVIETEYPENIEYYLKKINGVIEIRQIMGIGENDKWYLELEKRYEILCEYLDSKGTKTKTVTQKENRK